MTRIISTALISIAFSFSSNAQFFAQFSDEIEVYREGQQLTNPWAGGINAGQISKIDANMDGMEDVFIFDRSGNKTMVFLNNGSGDPNSFEYSFAHSQSFPEMRNWALLRDYNCDGKRDIFTYNGIGGFRIYENVSTESNPLQFVEIEDNLQSLFVFPSQSYYSNIFISSVDIPTIDDLDGDGDQDILVFSVSGVMIEYHQNHSVELTGSCDSLAFRLGNRCYGYFSESAFDNSITLHDEAFHDQMCPDGYNVANPSPIIERPNDIPFHEGGNTGLRHAGTSILALELNGQLPKEIVLGDVSNTNLTALTNSTTTSSRDSIIAQDTAFPVNQENTAAVHVTIFPAGFYEDMDNDGARDLLVCPNNEWASENVSSVWYYKNLGEDDEPDFELEQTNLFQQEMIEVGEGCAASFLDYNADGLMDMVISNKGRFVSPGVYYSSLALYENTGSSTEPEFTHITDDFAEIGALGLGQGFHPTFGDWDGDGDMDMLIGTSSGKIYAFNNEAGSGNTVDFQIADNAILKDVNGDDIDPGQFSTPQLFDLNNDGLLDLVMGERNGKVHFYKNTGTSSSPQFQLENDFLGGIETTEGFASTGYSTVCFFDYDGTRYLITGREAGFVSVYGNITDNLAGTFSLEQEELFGWNNGIRSSAEVIDIDNDGYLDFFAGNFGGGLHFFDGSAPTALRPIHSENRFVLYPNPAASAVYIQQSEGNLNNASVEFYNVTGKLVKRIAHTNETQPLSIADLPSGIYLVRLVNNGKPMGSQKMIVH